ncbi:PaaI family thioesterase [Paraglaciecola arctica]|uniref:PaaI family thioesterase n=1 Tax=Paraglaciecola arctica TaxID=1128911 RepID=UPI001C06E1BB|nr:PaaI family thioesterase [Paraglaciecola arctica]MBU3003085.1 PaaI family thioesterase [Paraglaciecola arctica]
MTDKTTIIEQINNRAPAFLKMLGGHVTDIDTDTTTCIFEFNISKEFCHSVDVVQGGFITAMLDAAMSHAVFIGDHQVINVSSLEIKTSYLEATRAGKLRVEGWVIKQSYKTAFMEGRVYNEANVLTATASSVAKIIRAKQ